MWGIIIKTLAVIAQLAIAGLLICLFFKKGKLRLVTKINYVYKRFGNKLNISYKRFHGFDYYYFRVKKHENVTVRYDVSVEEGSLTLEWRDSQDLIYNQTFFENERGEFIFTANMRLHSLKLVADQTRGGALIELIREGL